MAVHTIVHLYDDDSCDTFSGLLATEKPLTDEEKARIAKRFGAVIDGQPGSHAEDGRTISFRIAKPHTDIMDAIDLRNIFPIGPADGEEEEV